MTSQLHPAGAALRLGQLENRVRCFGRQHPHLAAILIGLLACTGCGEKRVPICGDITLDGKPVPSGAIALEPFDGKGPTTGGKITDGKYELVGASAPLPGKKRIRITGVRKTGRKVQADFAPPGTMIDEIECFVPKIYDTQSTLTCNVSFDGTNRIDFTLKSP